MDYTSTISLLIFIYRKNKNWDAPSVIYYSDLISINLTKAIACLILDGN
ncbi:hypothetical protein [Coleofasciculus sp. H7-2]